MEIGDVDYVKIQRTVRDQSLREEKMGYKHYGGHHRGGHSLPEDTRCNLVVRRRDHAWVAKYAEWNDLTMIDAVTYILDNFFGKEHRCQQLP